MMMAMIITVQIAMMLMMQVLPTKAPRLLFVGGGGQKQKHTQGVYLYYYLDHHHPPTKNNNWGKQLQRTGKEERPYVALDGLCWWQGWRAVVVLELAVPYCGRTLCSAASTAKEIIISTTSHCTINYVLITLKSLFSWRLKVYSSPSCALLHYSHILPLLLRLIS